MFKKKTFVATDTKPPPPVPPVSPKYVRPKILLVDLTSDVETVLEKEGYNIVSGSFGRPYKVTKGSNYEPVVVKASLPNYTEQEVVIIDLVPDKPSSEVPGDKLVPNEELDWWAKCTNGTIDPRPRTMAMIDDSFDRILATGGAFVIFSDSMTRQTLVWAQSFRNNFHIERTLHNDNWGFLSVLSNVNVVSDSGKEIAPVKEDWPIVRLLADYLEDAEFDCTLEPNYDLAKRWSILAKNKYGAAVAGAIAPREKTKEGWVFIFPQIFKKAEFLSAFLKNVLPNFSPSLFPHAEGRNWMHRTEYELPSVLDKQQQIAAIQDEASSKVTTLERSIKSDHDANQFLFDLLSETGGALVKAVKEALAVLGFVAVVDVDEEVKKRGNDSSLREDLQIHDDSPVLIVDVKGVAGHPADADALQAQKHAFIYIQEEKRADVRGLTIINHQRLLPPLDRDNEMPFRKEILDNATQVNLGLLTTWDLFRLTRGAQKNHWKPQHVRPLLYKTGRIAPIPTNYEPLGRVTHVWKTAFSITLEKGEIRLGDRIAIEFPVDFDEQTVSSLRLNDVDTESASAGTEVGVSREESRPKAKVGFPVYRLESA